MYLLDTKVIKLCDLLFKMLQFINFLSQSLNSPTIKVCVCVHAFMFLTKLVLGNTMPCLHSPLLL